ncbi:dUTP diphosphatase [Candidatus Microgenomates bacterium]|nr:dUTP diphosphatase [Candidatus Microgenomates bacterium]
MVKVKFQKLNKNAKIPSFAHIDDAGFDIYTNKTTVVKKLIPTIVSTGISSEFPVGYFVSFRDKSGLAAKHGIHVMGGVIDAGYRGEWGIILVNLGKKVYKFEKGDKVAQAIVHKLESVKLTISNSLSKTKRGKGGFGSTGKK